MRGLRNIQVLAAGMLVFPSTQVHAAPPTALPLSSWMKCTMEDGTTWRVWLEEAGGVFERDGKKWRSGQTSGSVMSAINDAGSYRINPEHTGIAANAQLKYQIHMDVENGIQISVSTINPPVTSNGTCLPEG